MHKYNRKILNNIDTKEKAYWHGFISADGFIGATPSKHIGFQLAIKDEVLVDRFIKFIDGDIFLKKYRIRKRDKYHTKDREYKYVMINLYSDELVDDFVKFSGISSIGKKAQRLVLPDFNSEELNLAWVMGYYDGDGSEKSARINSCNLALLSQIKERYNIPYSIAFNGKGTYILYVGKWFREKLCANYENSLPRKRVKLTSRKKGKENDRKFHTQMDNKVILTHITKTHSCEEIAFMFNSNRATVFSKIKKNNICVAKKHRGRNFKERILKTSCEYYPCHSYLETCRRCYCVLYPFDCGGNWCITNGFKDCSDCNIPHTIKGEGYILAQLEKIKKKGG